MAETSRRSFLGLGLGLGLGSTGVAACDSSGARGSRGSSAPADAATPARPVPVAARSADDVCNAYAVNTKLFYNTSVYGYTTQIVELLTELGVRTVRERMTTGTSPGARKQQAAMPRLARHGIRWHATVAKLEDWPRATQATAAVLAMATDFYGPAVDGDLPALLHSFGGCNEVDGAGRDGAVDPRWAEHARLMQHELWGQAGADQRTASIPVAGPSTRTDVTPERAGLLGNLSRVSDWGNAHLYGGGTSPTRGLDEQLATLAPVFGDPPRWFFTETGYTNSPQDNAGRSVSEEAAATYALRAICDYFVRDCIYGRFELMDDPDDVDRTSQATINATADPQAHFGLVAVGGGTAATATPDTWRRKPEFDATRRLLALMSDPGPRQAPQPLDLSLNGTTADLQHTVVQKRDGRHYVLLWRDVAVATTFPDPRPLAVPPVRVTAVLRTARPTVVYSPRYTEAPVAKRPARDHFEVDVAGDLVVVEIG